MVRLVVGLAFIVVAAPAAVHAYLPGQSPCGHPHKTRCCGIPNGPVPAPTPVAVSVDPKNVTHQINPLFNGCHSDSGEWLPSTAEATWRSAD
eukprot:COSAG06_NODE_4955_length_3833_cov_2.419657_3_plen_92_part_00